MVISGDGDLSAIGGNHLIHAARRNMDMTVICANNGIYGMTGGQVASTTPIGSRTSTTPKGNQEPPFDLCRLVEAAGATFVARQPVATPIPLTRTLKKAIVHRGFSFVDVLSPCPTQFGRRNALRSAHDMLASLKNTCISYEKAKMMSPEDVKGKILVGEFVGQEEGGRS
jgi:2-oxoglutarate ferredoxin oxidoreductase subunit beta